MLSERDVWVGASLVPLNPVLTWACYECEPVQPWQLCLCAAGVWLCIVLFSALDGYTSAVCVKPYSTVRSVSAGIGSFTLLLSITPVKTRPSHKFPFLARPRDYETTDVLVSHISPVYRKSDFWLSGMWTCFPKLKNRVYKAIYIHIHTALIGPGAISFIYELVHRESPGLAQQINKRTNQ